MNSIIDICYIIYRDYMITCMLTVEDNELAVGDNDNASSGVAMGRHMYEVSENSYRGTGGVI